MLGGRNFNIARFGLISHRSIEQQLEEPAYTFGPNAIPKKFPRFIPYARGHDYDKSEKIICTITMSYAVVVFSLAVRNRLCR